MSELSHLQALQDAVDFIEENLDKDVNTKDVASEVGFSEFHFHRVFTGTIGESVASYQRRRRLSRAAKRLKQGQDSILSIALQSGFTSQEAFSRAFKSLFGNTPGDYRRKGGLIAMEKVKLTPEMIRHLRGGLTMEPKFVDFGGQRVIGMADAFPLDSSPEIGQLWERFVSRCHDEDSLNLRVSYGVCIGEHPEIKKKPGDSFVYLAAVPVALDAKQLPPDMVSFAIPPGRYAVFTHKGPISSFPHTVKYVWGTWVAENRAMYRENAADFELYDDRFDPQGADSEVDIFIPVNT